MAVLCYDCLKTVKRLSWLRQCDAIRTNKEVDFELMTLLFDDNHLHGVSLKVTRLHHFNIHMLHGNFGKLQQLTLPDWDI